MTRRSFLKGGALALVALRRRPALPASRGAGAAAPRPAQGADRDLPARRGRRPQHGGAARRPRLLRGRGRPSRSRGPRRATPTRASTSTASSACTRRSRRSSRSGRAARWRSVHACGSPDTTRSHFDAQDYMDPARPASRARPTAGWTAALAALPAARRPRRSAPWRSARRAPAHPARRRRRARHEQRDRLRRAGGRAPAGRRRAAAASSRCTSRRARPAATATGRETFEAVKMLKARGARSASRRPTARCIRAGRFGDSLRQIAQLIRADVGLEVAFADMGGWDTHAGQGNERGQLATRLREFGEGLAALHRDLGDRMSDVVVLTMSEFGRTVRENGNRGTDHGHATAMLVLGRRRCSGGRVYGRWPGLAPRAALRGPRPGRHHRLPRALHRGRGAPPRRARRAPLPRLPGLRTARPARLAEAHAAQARARAPALRREPGREALRGGAPPEARPVHQRDGERGHRGALPVVGPPPGSALGQGQRGREPDARGRPRRRSGAARRSARRSSRPAGCARAAR